MAKSTPQIESTQTKSKATFTDLYFPDKWVPLTETDVFWPTTTLWNINHTFGAKFCLSSLEMDDIW